MLRRLVAAATVASVAVPVALATAPAARAQDLVSICEHAIHPSVGDWSEFRIVGGRDDGGTFRMAVVGRESRGGKSYVWIEVDARGMRTGSGQRDTISVITKSLVPDLGDGVAHAVARVMKIGSNPAMEMPGQMSRGAEPGTNMLSKCRSAKTVGWERVTVPAGTFRALHVQDAERHSDTWVTGELPFAIVKGTSGRGDASSVVLAGHGKGARSRITEKPRAWDPMAFRQMMMGAAGR